MKYVNNTHTHIGGISYIRKTQADQMIYDGETDLEDLSHEQLNAILNNCYTIYPLALNILPHEGNFGSPASALARYILDRSFPLDESIFKNTAGKVIEFLKSVELDPDNYLVFPADKEVFKDNFLESDYLVKGKVSHNMSGVSSLVDFYKSPILNAQFKETLLNWDGSYDKVQVVGTDGQDFIITLSDAEVNYYLNLPIWEFIWQSLIYSQNLIEINGYCLVDRAGLDVVSKDVNFLLGDVSTTLEVLEVISKVPLISKALEAERLKFIASIKMLYNKLTSAHLRFFQAVQEQYRSLTEAEIKNLKISAGQKSVKEVANSYGW